MTADPIPLIERLPAKILANHILPLLSDYYSIRSLCYAFPKLADTIKPTIGYFVLHGPSDPIRKTGRYKEQRAQPKKSLFSGKKVDDSDDRLDSFARWFNNSINLSGPSATPAESSNTFHFSMGDIIQQGIESLHPSIRLWADDNAQITLGSHRTTIRSPEPYLHEYSEGDIPKMTIGTFGNENRGQNQIRAYEANQFSKKFYKCLFDQSAIKTWFEQVKIMSQKFKHVVFIMDLPEQSGMVDVTMLLYHLFFHGNDGSLDKTFKTDFSVVSLKHEWNNRWEFLDYDVQGALSFVDHLDGVNVKYDSRYSKGVVFDLNFHEMETMKNSTEAYKKRFDRFLFDSKVLEFIKLLMVESSATRDQKVSICAKFPEDIQSITEISNFKSFDVINFRDYDELFESDSKLKYFQKHKHDDILFERHNGFDDRNFSPRRSVYEDYEQLEANLENIQKMYDLTFEDYIKDTAYYRNTQAQDTRMERRMEVGSKTLSKELFQKFMHSMPWIKGQPLEIRMNFYTQ